MFSAWSVRYWRAKGGAKLDLVLSCGARLVGVEVKAGVAPGLTRSMQSFIDAYAPSDMLIVTDQDHRLEPPVLEGRTRVWRVGLVDLMWALTEITGEDGSSLWG